MKMGAEVLDVAIVGAGVSGAWCGWRLTDPAAGPGRRGAVAVFEAGDRVGGRLLSLELPGLPGVACELGGMRYTSSQRLVRWLVEDQLGLARQPAPVAEASNLAYLRGRRLRQGSLADPAVVPYDLAGADRGKTPDALLSEAVARIVPAVGSASGEALRKAVESAVFEGRPVWAQGFWNLLARTMSHEAYRFAEEAGGYDTVMLNWNAADTIMLNFDFDPTVEFHRITPGFETVPRQLAQRFEDQGGALHLRTRVRSVDVTLLDDGSTGVVLAVEDGTGGTRTVRARAVILAMPRRSLELIEPTGVLADPHFRRLLTTVTPIPLFKAFVAYHEPWWESVGVTRGRSVTDLPLRQVYYWASGGAGHNAALLATYDDTLNVGFWQGLATQAGVHELALGHVPPERAREISDHLAALGDRARWRRFQTSPALVAEVHRQLVELHGVERAPAPYAAVYHDWSADPFGGGVNFWNRGVKSGETIPRMVSPVAGAPVYVCGEAYSDTQGWVEGALRTAELVLTDHLGLAPAPVAASPA